MEEESSEGSQSHQAAKYGIKSRGVGSKTRCAGEDQQQFSS
jgi:hypothetical protein